MEKKMENKDTGGSVRDPLDPEKQDGTSAASRAVFGGL